jgi:hypothetical protein
MSEQRHHVWSARATAGIRRGRSGGGNQVTDLRARLAKKRQVYRAMDARVVERSLHEANERVVVLAHVLDFGFRLRDHGYDAISAFSAARGSTRLRCVVSKGPG